MATFKLGNTTRSVTYTLRNVIGFADGSRLERRLEAAHQVPGQAVWVHATAGGVRHYYQPSSDQLVFVELPPSFVS
jgi:hypothetical protein